MSSLFLVSIDIGNRDDITLRALKILKSVKNIVCEEYKIAKQIIRYYDLGEKNLYALNEHSDDSDVDFIMSEYLLKGEDVALFSDTGTPVFADPGLNLSRRAYNSGINVVPIPGASSLMAAIVKSDIDLKRFYFYGFLSPKRKIRDDELKKLKRIEVPIIFLDAPYRLSALLESIKRSIAKERYINVLLDLTGKNEKNIRGPVKNVCDFFLKNPYKGEFVVILEGFMTRKRR